MALRYETPPKVGKSPGVRKTRRASSIASMPRSRAAIMSRVDGAACDLSVDYFVGMPSFQAAGDPAFRCT